MKKINILLFLLAFQIQVVANSTPLAAAGPTQLKCWGDNSFGQSEVPADLHPKDLASQIVEVHMGEGLTCARNSLGSIQCFGRKGDSYNGYNFPAVEFLEGLKNVSEFGIGMYGACAIINGDVTCSGQFSKVPPGLKAATKMTMGTYSVCVNVDQKVVCWSIYDMVPPVVPAPSASAKIESSSYDVCVLDHNKLQCFEGGNGDGFGYNPIPDLKNPRDFFSLEAHICAIDDAGMHCWGKGLLGRPKLPTPPAAIPGAHYVAGRDHFCALSADQVSCYGDNSKGQTNVPTLLHPSKIFSDRMSYQTCAIDDTGLVCWGDNSVGQISFPAFSSISAGFGNTCIVDNGKPRCWGKGSLSINATASMTDSYETVVGSNFACSFNASQAAQSCWGDDMLIKNSAIFSSAYEGNLAPFASAGYHHICFSNEQEVKCAGSNEYGEATPPVKLLIPQKENQLSAGGHHTCAIQMTGSVKCWGQNKFGQSDAPKNLKNPRFISSGFQHSCVIDDDGVKCWGRNSEGQNNVPTLVNPTEVSAGGLHTCAVDSTGLHCWGNNSYGQLKFPVGSQISHLSAGYIHTCAEMK